MHTANVYGGFPAISMEKCCTNHRETLYSSSLYTYVVGKPYTVELGNKELSGCSKIVP